MFTKNQTVEWLQSARAEVKLEKLPSSARKETRSVQKQFQERHRKVIEKHRRSNQENMQRTAAARRSKLQQLDKYTTDTVYHGLWQKTAQVDNMSATLKGKNLQMEPLKTQLCFRKHVLKQDMEDKTDDDIPLILLRKQELLYDSPQRDDSDRDETLSPHKGRISGFYQQHHCRR